MKTGLRTAAVGSLPHHNVDAALKWVFELDLPTLPQIPKRNSWEYMLPQALEGLPGLEVDSEGSCQIDLHRWEGLRRHLDEKLDHAFKSREFSGFEAFEPTASTYSAWEPFLWEATERKVPQVKVQLAGPLTSAFALSPKNGRLLDYDLFPELSTQVVRLGLARLTAMARRLKHENLRALVVLDEPGLYALDLTRPLHQVAWQEWKLLLHALSREPGIEVGVHCCSDTDWNLLLEIPELRYLSLDTALSLASLKLASQPLQKFLERGGTLGLGALGSGGAHLVSKASLVEFFQEFSLARESSLLTPSCGLALISTLEAEEILRALKDLKMALQRER
jgi:methionine synthase II (cobalamin-independent)